MAPTFPTWAELPIRAMQMRGGNAICHAPRGTEVEHTIRW